MSDSPTSYRPTPQAWMADALCAQVDTAIFYPGKGEPTAPGKRICAACPVRPDCLSHALDNGEVWGTWGGLSERERRKLRPASEGRPRPALVTDAIAGVRKPARRTAA